jgi:hypothetical protein
MATFHFACPHCSQRLEAPVEAAGSNLSCPACGKVFQLPVPVAAETPPSLPPSPAPSAGAAPSGPICNICLSPMGDADARTVCSECRTEYHSDCWQENGGCAVYGCSQVPAVELRSSIEIPMSYWGQEHKQCPSCGFQILAAAVRCRNCGATFASARPQDADEFRQRNELTQRLPAARRTIVIIFIFSILSCLAPIGAVWGLIWYPTHREEVRALPSLYGALCKIGLLVAIGQTVAIVLLTVLFLLTQR